eukprot:CAMPEP_0205831644 /NCGR_PEP_ID=MMETSP0206-20130828/44664_1 /ASSEMBLY_ACC=CAM_ASM_000279 /TAXON_ID=36767 /ORGANISM="Euplotes focardii, Strain TN1" /LENGTH=397 /DNA_ID=CAMNT_0053136467 /DNA_START=56 /DNA_END=1249 /DNA_ORIENTATION=-
MRRAVYLLAAYFGSVAQADLSNAEATCRNGDWQADSEWTAGVTCADGVPGFMTYDPTTCSQTASPAAAGSFTTEMQLTLAVASNCCVGESVCAPAPIADATDDGLCVKAACTENGGTDDDCCGLGNDVGCVSGYLKTRREPDWLWDPSELGHCVWGGVTCCTPTDQINKGEGDACSANLQCGSLKCDGAAGAMTCCAAGSTPVGSDCSGSGECCASGAYCFLGKCKAEVENGGTCVEDKGCQSGLCCESSDTDVCTARGVCQAKKAQGARCPGSTGDKYCSNGWCNDRVTPNVCAPLVGRGGGCQRDEECVGRDECRLDGGSMKCSKGWAEAWEDLGDAVEDFAKGLLIALIVGGILAVLGIVLCIWCCCCKNKNQPQAVPQQATQVQQVPTAIPVQ